MSAPVLAAVSAGLQVPADIWALRLVQGEDTLGGTGQGERPSVGRLTARSEQLTDAILAHGQSYIPRWQNLVSGATSGR